MLRSISLVLLAALLLGACGDGRAADDPLPTFPMAQAPTAATATVLPNASRTGAIGAVPAPVRCYVDAVNALALDTLVGCFAPDGLVVDVRRQIAGREAIRTWANNEAIGGSLEVLAVDAQREGHVRLLVHWAPSGSQGWRAFYTFDYANGQVTRADLQYA